MRRRLECLQRAGAMLKNQKGVALLTVYFAALSIVGITSAAYTLSFTEMRHVEREMARLRSYAAAEAGLQSALQQIGNEGYTGFIDTTALAATTFTDVYGNEIGTFQATMEYPNQADWVTVTATATVEGETRTLEGRVFLESNFSKFLVFANTSNFGSGTNAQYGYHDGENPLGVPANEDDRMAMYFTNEWTISGSGVAVYGDVNAESHIDANASANVYGDTYAGDFSMSITGTVTDDGIEGSSSLTVSDGFSDDSDRNGDATVDADDAPDKHDLTSTGSGDAHQTETLVNIDHSFYNTNNSIPSFSSSTQSRYIELVPSAGGTTTQIVEYDSVDYDTEVTTHTIPSSAIVYVQGDMYVRGQVQGRVSFVASDDIYVMDDVTYANGATSASTANSTAFMAKDKVYLIDTHMDVTGILYGENSSNSSTAIDAYYGYSPNQGIYGASSTKEYLRLHGNRVLNGGSNLSYYDDRVYGYDRNLRYFRPPGIPVDPELRTVREVDTPVSS